MRVCLINPPSPFLLDERVFMSLGVLKVAAAMEQAGHDVEVLDLAGISNFEDVAAHHAAGGLADVYGVTATTPQMPSAVKIQAAIRKARPGARIILGGPHVTLVNAARKHEEKAGTKGRGGRAMDDLYGKFDALVAGDGESAGLAALHPLAPRLIDADDPKSEYWLTHQGFTDSPLPARHLIDVDSYHYEIEGERALSLVAQLGCPFHCGFCGGRTSKAFRQIRLRSSESVIGEIEHLHKTYGVKGFMFYDDELNVNPKMPELMHLIADKQEALGEKFRLRGFVKAELFTDAQAEAMYRAGFRWILCGFESGSERILRNIQKRATQADNTRCMAIARRSGLKVKALMSLGHPGESEATIMDTRDWLLDMAPEDFDATIITAYPGTPYFDAAAYDPGKRAWKYEINGDALYTLEVDYTERADYYKGDPSDGYISHVFTDHLSPEELVALRNRLESELRTSLGLAYPAAAPALQFEHSMGQIMYGRGGE